MRWPFGHRSTSPDRAAAPAPAAPAAARPHDAWRRLPAVQRAVGRPPLVAPADVFADHLATRRPPELALQPLGHEVSPLATPGRLIGVARPAGAANAGRIDLPLQRMQGQPDGGPAELAWSSFDPPLTAAPIEAGPPVAFQRLAPDDPVLTSSAPTVVPAAPAGRLDIRPAGSVAGPPASPLQRSAAPDSDPAAAVIVAQAPAPVVLPAARRPTLGEARRLGLGAPLRPGTAPAVQRSEAVAGGASAFLPRGLPTPTATATLAGSAARSGQADRPASLPPSEAGEPPVDVRPTPSTAPDLLLVRPIAIQRIVAGDAPATVDGPTAWSPGDAPGGLPIVPLAGRAALVEIDRDALQPDATGSLPDSEPAALPGATTAPPAPDAGDWLAPVAGGSIRVSSAASLLAPVQRTAWVGSAGRTAPARPETPPANAWTAPGPGAPVGRPAVSGAPGAWPPPVGPADQPGRALPVQLSMGSAATAVSPAVLPLVPALAPRPAPVEAGRPMSSAGTIQRESDAPSAGPAPAGGSTPVADAAAATASAAGMAGAGASPAERDRELDDLARRLYGRIRARLSAELLADRERAGQITDLR